MTGQSELIDILYRAFVSCDLDRSGTIDERELGICLRGAGFEPTLEDVRVCHITSFSNISIQV